MPDIAARLALLTTLSGIALGSAAGTAPAQTDADQRLKDKGVVKVKGKYRLAAEQEAFQGYRQALAAMEEAGQAVALAGDAAARNQSILEFQQRIAFDSGLRDQMRVEMRDGRSLAEQTTRRAAARDLAIARQQRALAGQAKAQVRPREAKRLADQAAEACRKAKESRQALAEKVRDVADRYQALAADPDVRAALGDARLVPSDGFKKLADGLGIRTKRREGTPGKVSPSGEVSKRIDDAVAQLGQARDLLRGIEFRKDGPQYEARAKRRDDTVKAIEGAVERLKRGEADPKVLDTALKLNNGYTGRLIPKVRGGIDEAGKRLEKAAELLRGP
jgi:hypothetical protein